MHALRGPTSRFVIGCLTITAGLAAATLGSLPAHAALPLPSAAFCSAHQYVTAASDHYSVIRVGGTCFPFPSSAHIAIRDLTTGAVLRPWTTIPVALSAPLPSWGGQFHYVTRGDARRSDAIRFWVVHGAWHRLVTVTDVP